MSVLGMQADELRGYALSVRNVALRTTSLCHEARRDLLDSAVRMEQAADTIISLRDRLQESECEVVKSYGKHPVTNNDVVLYNCSKCGKWIGLSANYCGNCGARIRKAVDA